MKMEFFKSTTNDRINAIVSNNYFEVKNGIEYFKIIYELKYNDIYYRTLSVYKINSIPSMNILQTVLKKAGLSGDFKKIVNGEESLINRKVSFKMSSSVSSIGDIYYFPIEIQFEPVENIEVSECIPPSKKEFTVANQNYSPETDIKCLIENLTAHSNFISKTISDEKLFLLCESIRAKSNNNSNSNVDSLEIVQHNGVECFYDRKRNTYKPVRSFI